VGRVILADIQAVAATCLEGTSHTWQLPLDRHSFRSVIHSKAVELSP
jgi:hypothetical protein